MVYELWHHGILGMRWGVRRYQNSDGSLTSAGRKRYSSGLDKQDAKWVKKQSEKITNQAKKDVSQELSLYDRQLLQNPNARKTNGKLSAATINAHNKKMAELMNERVSELASPSGKAVKFVAKRGELGVMMALADQGYNMDQLKNGVWTSGRVAYKQTVLEKA